jgi:hypothetical protein
MVEAKILTTPLALPANLSPQEPTPSAFSPKKDIVKGDEAELFSVKNLDTGESLDIRNENSAHFPDTYTRVVAGLDVPELEVKEFL